jgi:flagellar basal body P-ring formation protein FlgA
MRPLWGPCDEIVGSRGPNISAIRRGKPAQFEAPECGRRPTVSGVKASPLLVVTCLCVALLAAAAPAFAQAADAPRAQAIEAALSGQVQLFALDASLHAAAPGLRVQVRVGRLDPRLHLAPCAVVQPYLPAGTRLWGAARIGLRCIDAAVRWNVFLPINVDVFGPALVANEPLAAGRVLVAGDLRSAEVNLAASPSLPLIRNELAIGRTLARPLAVGDALHSADLRVRQWFAAGDSVRLVATGNGWLIGGEGQALAAGLEGQTVRVRTESGRVVSGVAVAERLVEVAL